MNNTWENDILRELSLINARLDTLIARDVSFAEPRAAGCDMSEQWHAHPCEPTHERPPEPPNEDWYSELHTVINAMIKRQWEAGGMASYAAYFTTSWLGLTPYSPDTIDRISKNASLWKWGHGRWERRASEKKGRALHRILSSALALTKGEMTA